MPNLQTVCGAMIVQMKITLGATYPELEWAMAQQEAGKSASDFSGREAEVMAIYLKFNTANKHKMRIAYSGVRDSFDSAEVMFVIYGCGELSIAHDENPAERAGFLKAVRR